jgi:type IV secretory pathway VirB10-like protein
MATQTTTKEKPVSQRTQLGTNVKLAAKRTAAVSGGPVRAKAKSARAAQPQVKREPPPTKESRPATPAPPPPAKTSKEPRVRTRPHRVRALLESIFLHKTLTIFGFVVAAFLLLVFGLDLVLGWPLMRASMVMDVGACLSALLLTYVSWDTYRGLR